MGRSGAAPVQHWGETRGVGMHKTLRIHGRGKTQWTGGASPAPTKAFKGCDHAISWRRKSRSRNFSKDAGLEVSGIFCV